MRVYTLPELFCMTRNQLSALHAEIVAELNSMPEGSPERENALFTLRCIGRALTHPGKAPG